MLIYKHITNENTFYPKFLVQKKIEQINVYMYGILKLLISILLRW